LSGILEKMAEKSTGLNCLSNTLLPAVLKELYETDQSRFAQGSHQSLSKIVTIFHNDPASPAPYSRPVR
jgi:hypothetical protein